MAELVIGLCDDEEYIHVQMEEWIREYEVRQGLHYELKHFYAGREVLHSCEPLDVLFLDIDMPDMDGIELGMRLNQKGISYKIVMLTAREDRYREAFKIGAFRFVPKIAGKTDLFETIQEVEKHILGTGKVTVYRDGAAYSIMQRSIVYIMAERSATWIFTDIKDYRSEKSLEDWKRELDDRLFYMCHKSYLVNFDKIRSIEDSTIQLKTGEKICVSKRRKKAFLQAFMGYDTNHK